MSQTIHLEPKQVPATLRGNYSGKSFKVCVCETVTIRADAGGTCDTYAAVRISDGVGVAMSDNTSAPWDANRQDRTVALHPGVAIVRHSTFCGKDMGLTIYICAADAAPMLPAPVELTDNERIVLEATRSLKSSYQGKDRYEMSRANVRWSSNPEFMSRAEWDAAKQALIGRGLLNKAGAITVAGRNACPY